MAFCNGEIADNNGTVITGRFRMHLAIRIVLTFPYLVGILLIGHGISQVGHGVGEAIGPMFMGLVPFAFGTWFDDWNVKKVFRESEERLRELVLSFLARFPHV